MARVKGNLAPEWPSLAYELVPAEEHDCSAFVGSARPISPRRGCCRSRRVLTSGTSWQRWPSYFGTSRSKGGLDRSIRSDEGPPERGLRGEHEDTAAG